MRMKTFVTLVVLVVALIAMGIGLRGDGGRVTRWLASLHGSGH